VARTEHRLTRKDLRQPDEILTITRQGLRFVEENRAAVTAALGAIIVLLLAIVAYRTISLSREASAATAYTEARALLSDKKYGEAAIRFDDVATRYSGTSYGPLALLERGNALILADQAADAATVYERFLQGSPPTNYLRQLGYTRLGYAQEKLGKSAEAQRSFGTAAAEPGPFVAEALFGAARNAEIAGDTAKAKELYVQLLEKHPTTEYRDVAVTHLINLGGTPPAKPPVAADLPGSASE
jgi:outer membrane protein assembly factor BamD (BamD/ComL family)